MNFAVKINYLTMLLKLTNAQIKVVLFLEFNLNYSSILIVKFKNVNKRNILKT